MKIKWLQLETCCCFLPLGSGAKFFGFLSLTGSILLLIIGCAEFISYSIHVHSEDHGPFVAYICVNIAAQIVQSSTAVLLLLGAYQAKSSLIPYWLFTTPFVALLELFFLSSVTLQFIEVHPYKADWIIFNAITVFDDVYGWLVVYSYYCTILPSSPDLV